MKPTFCITHPGRLEIRFDAVPPPDIRGGLRERGFWWNPASRCWWLARPVHTRIVRQEPVTQDGFAWALRFCMDYLGLTAEQAERLTREHAFSTQQAGERGIEEACGIA